MGPNLRPLRSEKIFSVVRWIESQNRQAMRQELFLPRGGCRNLDAYAFVFSSFSTFPRTLSDFARRIMM